MNVNTYSKIAYNNETAFRRGKNKPNSNPIKPNCRKGKIDAKCVFTKHYRKKDDFSVRINKPNFRNGQNERKLNFNRALQKKRLFGRPKNKPNQTQSLVKDLIALVKKSCARLWVLLQCFFENFDKPGEPKTKGKFRLRLRIPHLLSIGSSLIGAGHPMNLLGIMPAKEGKIVLKHSFYGSAFVLLSQKIYEIREIRG